jgi:hypothetical protein
MDEKDFFGCNIISNSESTSSSVDGLTESSDSVVFILRPKPTKVVIDLTETTNEDSTSNNCIVQINKQGRYCGSVNNLNEKDGFGEMKYNTGNVYKGDFCNNQRHGYGHFKQVKRLSMSGGRSACGIYEGQWKNDKKSGYGSYRFSDGALYKGNFHKGSMHGRGTMTEMGGVIYEGKWRMGICRDMGGNSLAKKTRGKIDGKYTL